MTMEGGGEKVVVRMEGFLVVFHDFHLEMSSFSFSRMVSHGFSRMVSH